MKNILTTLKLIDTFTLELDINKNDFIKNFKQHIKSSEFSFPSNTLDFSSNKTKYKGYIKQSEFKISKPLRAFKQKNFAVADGIFIQKDNKLFIETKIFIPNEQLFNFYFFIVMFIIGLIIFIFNHDDDGVRFLFGFGSIIGSVVFFFGILMAQDGVRSLKYELNKEFKNIELMQKENNKLN
ncbi:hypothetical protein UJ101_00104 [Flavobacteriaceae bacterium UJ101]|nr:hypothetical protein UJ101_00104 [Flavobacteriaceae bacterium UJ101]